jgi:hypothetical protein
MVKPAIILFRKELRQNGFIYLFPFIVICAALAFQKTFSQMLSVSWAKNFAVAIPVALAFTYALQAFDLEESNQTRDFLVTKPLPVPLIILIKFFTGLLILLPLTFIWHLTLIPGLIQWPDLLNLNSFWFLAYLLMVTIVYSISFTIAAWIKGPKKLLIAILVSTIGVIWFFFGWLQFLTHIYFASFTEIPLISTIIAIVSLVPIIILIKGLLVMIHSQFLNLTPSDIIHRIKPYFLLLLFPLLFYAANLIHVPEILPFKSLLACLNGSEEPFLAVDIAKQPEDDLYALTDIRGRLGIAKRGQNPTVIYQGEKEEGNLLSKLIWSPDGGKIAFNENGIIKVLDPSLQEPINLITGDIAFWSPDSKVLLIAKKINTIHDPAAGYRVPYSFYRLSYISIDTKAVYEFKENLSFPGSSMFWHSSQNIILAVTDLWEIAVMNLNNGKVEILKIPTPKYEPIFLTEITPYNNDTYRIAVFTDIKKLGNNNFRYNLFLYDFATKDKSLKLIANLKNFSYQDLIINAEKGQIWASNSFGAYRQIKIPRGGYDVP